jgi:endonuclease YncB( thermonuclease family)
MAPNVNHALVKQGWCWWCRKYAPGDRVLEGLEKEEREAKKGLWADPAPIPPWVYRKARRDGRVRLADTSNPLPTGRKFWLGLL